MKSTKRERFENVVRIPPLPKIPSPPCTRADPRQQRTSKIVQNLTKVLSRGAQMETSNVASGFPASAVDLGALKDALEGGIARFAFSHLRERWDEDVRSWMQQVVHAWVQRCKLSRIRLFDQGIDVSLETQDDHGYYHYRFDVFWGRQRKKK